VAVDTEIHHVKSRGDAYFNTPISLALMAVLGRADWEAFEPKHLQNPAVKDFAAKVHVYVDEEIESAYPQKRSAGVLVKLKNGRRLSIFQEFSKGEPETPLSYAETADKFRSEAGEYLEDSDVSLIISAVEKAEGKAERIFSLLTGNLNKG
jgi:2-methylcitrate dehydratase PrpD